MDIESQEIPNKELNRLCNKICLCIGWPLVLSLII